ncbi:unnamed protein product [Toxocara canis]|uniref:Uncharacterized protein n=1 Tax=Toxocara canis TaxID=6265 RepID=A0A183U731_TOXCA|nr:unnamed protein product [Toxocara canis]
MATNSLPADFIVVGDSEGTSNTDGDVEESHTPEIGGIGGEECVTNGRYDIRRSAVAIVNGSQQSGTLHEASTPQQTRGNASSLLTC